ncbi:hypothetical protein FACS1894142_1520 [Spirochaetia bacterium]|nr:hypothetical protein FACS1894142_1520 [Spirochaetia bacterium]
MADYTLTVMKELNRLGVVFNLYSPITKRKFTVLSKMVDKHTTNACLKQAGSSLRV